MVGADDRFAVELHPGDRLDLRAGGQNDVAALNHDRIAFGRSHFDLASPCQPPGAFDQGDAVFPEQELHTFGAGGYNGGVFANSTSVAVDQNWGLEVQKSTGVDDYNTRLKYYPVTGGARKAGIYNSRTASFSLYSDSNNNPNIIIPDGNVGIGTTTPSVPLEVAGRAIIGTGTLSTQTDALLTLNAPNAFAGLDITSQRASGNIGGLRFTNSSNTLMGLYLVTTVGNHTWYAGGASLKMTLLANGNLGIGVTGPLSPLTVKANTGGSALRFIGRSDGISGIDFFNSTQTVGNYFQSNGTWIRSRADGGFHFSKGSTPITTDVDGFTIEGMNVGIGTTNPGAKLEVNGDVLLTYLKATANSVIGGTSINSSRLSIQDSKNGSASSPHLQILGNGYSAYHYLNTTAYNIVTNSTSREIRVIAQNGGVKLTPGATAWASNSDIALKENINPLENVLDKIKDYKCVEYNLKNSPEDKKIGFIAQDWVNDFSPIINKDKNDMLSMKYTETIPVLLKAIQELTARVKELENK